MATAAAAILRRSALRHNRILFSAPRAAAVFGAPKFQIPPAAVVAPPSLSSIRWFAKAREATPRIQPDENLKRVLDSEIECAVQSADESQDVDLPDDFPFEIIDNPGDQTVILKRKFGSETIQVSVFMNLDGDENMNEDDENGSEDDDNATADSAIQPDLSLIVMIDKGEGPALEFCCSLRPDGLEIDSMLMKKQDDPDDENAYQGPQFSDLDESLQKAFQKYLEARGIKSSLFDFLHQYMLNKDDREYLTWLKNMKDFVGK